MKKTGNFQSLHDAKFAPIKNGTLAFITGGERTPGGSVVLRKEFGFNAKGDRIQRSYIKSYTGDDITATTECYDNLEHCFSDWVVE